MAPIDPPVLDAGAGLWLRGAWREDVDAVLAACEPMAGDRWLNFPDPYERTHAADWLQRCHDDHAAGRAVHLLAERDGRVVGSFSLMELTRAPRYGEVGYWVTPALRGRGIATRGLARVREWGAEGLGLERIEVLVDEENVPSRRVAVGGGFTETTERRLAPRHEDPGPPRLIVHVWQA